MKTYLVGGAVRDKLLSIEVKERDWVVVGATPTDLLKKGFKPVGKDFPVFLHPKTHEEYALARTERKVAPGYTGFVFHAEPTVTLEEDLQRRDLTINAIAQDETGNLIDPFHGQRDLQNKILRHVSSAFVEDPVRILRLARFAARFADFTVADETMKLMQAMVTNKEVDALVPERVWQEMQKALTEKAPHRFFEILNSCHALTVIFPELVDNELATQRLKNSLTITKEPMLRFAVLISSFNNIRDFCSRWRAPKEWYELAELIYQHITDLKTINNAEKILTLLQKLDAYRRPERFANWLLACQACLPDANIQSHIELLQKALSATKNISLTQEEFNTLSGIEIQQAIYKKRLHTLEQLC